MQHFIRVSLFGIHSIGRVFFYLGQVKWVYHRVEATYMMVERYNICIAEYENLNDRREIRAINFVVNMN